MAASPDLPVPTGSTVDVSVILAGLVTYPASMVIKEPLPGNEILPGTPCYSFLIENKAKGKKILFDLGLVKAWKKKLPPVVLDQIASINGELTIEKDVADHLLEANVPLESIDGIIWSHHHMDHVGDPSLFPSSTSLIVGPGFKSNKMTFPGYPKNPDALVSDDAYHGRELIELDFSAASLEIGGFPALDYFGDGSFFLLYTKGHTHDHLSGLARTSENKFVFLGGDIAHHAGEFRPSPQQPLPDEIYPSPLDSNPFDPQLPPLSVCPGSVIEKLYPRKETHPDYTITPFYEPNPLMSASQPDALAAIEKLQVFDASAKVFVIIAHDVELRDFLPYFPNKINNWDTAGYEPLVRWRFLKDFLQAVA
ncbi:metallo-beta-lactamase superfamily protein [Aspergillus granulosus]|uniref:Metallo-beta-lactamase superfamily protein n=1 Tax=Aspergillus granulosus TaxID=176169 RepID=A0ABR4I2P7_9EURO